MRILIVTGEASGDLHGAHLAKAMMALDPMAQLVGIGGSGMRAAGVSLVPGCPTAGCHGIDRAVCDPSHDPARARHPAGAEGRGLGPLSC